MKYPDFEVLFRWFDFTDGECLSFTDITIDDIGHSDKIVVLSGEKE